MGKEIILAGIAGSLRKESYNAKLLHVVSGMLPEGVRVNILSFADLPIYNEDTDLPIAASRPPAVNAFRDELAKVDGIVIVSPEYNYSIPGGLKNAIDWASHGSDSPLTGKHVSLMGATMGMWGTVRMQMAFYPVFQVTGLRRVSWPEVLVAQAQNKFDAQGNLTDEYTIKAIRDNLLALKEQIQLNRK